MAVVKRSQPTGLSNGSPRMKLSDVTTKGSGLPNRYILHGVEKVGKTSFASYAPKPLFIQTKGETGLETLIEAGMIPEIPHFPEMASWADLMDAIEMLSKEDHDYKTLVIDTLNGAERMCHEFVCERDYNGNWKETGFVGYQRGYETSLADWRQFLSMLDNLRTQKKMMIFCLCHTQVKSFKNPEGPDYDRYSPAMHHKTWELCNRWTDVILFVNHETFVDTEGNRAKGSSANGRTIYTVRHAAYDAGNRLGLPEEIDMGSSAQEGWSNFTKAIQDARKRG